MDFTLLGLAVLGIIILIIQAPRVWELVNKEANTKEK